MSPIYLWIFLLFILEFPYLYLIPPLLFILEFLLIHTWISHYSYLNFPHSNLNFYYSYLNSSNIYTRIPHYPWISPTHTQILSQFIPEFPTIHIWIPPYTWIPHYLHLNPATICTWISPYLYLNFPLSLYLNFPLSIPEFPSIFMYT